jgi:ADP-ribose pyrophosphatase
MILEETLDSKYYFKGKILKLRVDIIQFKNGKISQREIVEHPGAVAIVAINEKKEVILVTQFRKPVEEVLLEIPAGKIDRAESPLECAKRELLEETGYVAEDWKEIFSLYTTPGFSNEKIVIYMAKGLKQQNDLPMDSQEIYKCELLKIDKVIEMIKLNHIKDAKTAAGIFAAKVFVDS